MESSSCCHDLPYSVENQLFFSVTDCVFKVIRIVECVSETRSNSLKICPREMTVHTEIQSHLLVMRVSNQNQL